MSPLLLAQLAHVAYRDAEGIADSYAWPPRPPLTEEERVEIDRLQTIADELSAKARSMGQENQGTDALFGQYAVHACDVCGTEPASYCYGCGASCHEDCEPCYAHEREMRGVS